MKNFDSCKKTIDNVVEAKKVFEEVYYNTAIPQPNLGSEIGVRGFVDMIEPRMRAAALNLLKNLKDDESVVYSTDRKSAEVIKSVEVPDYVQRGYIIIYEEANVAPAPSGNQFKNTDGSFDKVSARDMMLFGKNKKELKNYKGKKFKVSPDIFRRFEEGYARYNRWDKFIEEEDDSPIVDAIKKYSLQNPKKPVVIENNDDGEVIILRRRTNDARLKHNRSK
jgi:hypothetical protein